MIIDPGEAVDRVIEAMKSRPVCSCCAVESVANEGDICLQCARQDELEGIMAGD